MFDPRKHNAAFLGDTVEFTHIMLEMLDEYSKGKVLTIQTQRKRKVKKNKKKAKKNREAGEMEEFAEDLDFSDGGYEDDDLTDEENVERTFNFVSELSVLVDYDVISKYAFILKHESIYSKKPLLIKACSSFFKRIISQTKQSWIFFQVETLSIFNDFLQKDISNNSLMRGILEKKASTVTAKQLEAFQVEMKSVINMITAKFTELLKKNKMLGVEILFRFPTREIKD